MKSATAKVQAVPPKEASLQGKVKSDFPKHTLQEATRVAAGLEAKSGGQPLPPLETAEAIEMSPGSSEFRVILSSSIKYGLTSGSFNSERVNLEERGRNIVEPISDETRRQALVEAALTPPTFKTMYQGFKGKKLPEPAFFENLVAREFGVPKEHAKKCVDIFVANMEHVGLVKSLSNGKWLSTGVTAQPDESSTETALPKTEAELPPATTKGAVLTMPSAKLRVFIAHGKNAQVVAQLKDVLTFGNFDAVIAEENETVAKPVPDKVLDLMRQCSAGIIHVASEDELLDKSGTTHHKLNENVLVEIGAAMALYGRKFILLVQKGLHLPSNLSGLYCCFYDGEKLDYEATMKLLKAFSEFRAQ